MNDTFTVEVFRDPIPLKIEDLLDVEIEDYSYYLDCSNTPLLSKVSASQTIRRERSAPEIRYRIVDIKVPFLYEICVKEFKEDFYGNAVAQIIPESFSYKEISLPTWDAKSVYLLYRDSVEQNALLLRWGTRIVYFESSWVLTPKQTEIAAEILRSV